MSSPIQELFTGLTAKLVGFLPNLVAGAALLLIAWFFGWLGKRLVVHILATFRFDRPLQKFRWGAPLGRADVRHAFYSSLGNLMFLIIFLIFLNASFDVLGLTVLSDILRGAILFLPRFLICLALIGLGWLVGGWVSLGVQRALSRENVPRAGLIARFSKSVVFLFFSAMALTQLDLAREIVIIGFSVAIITLSAITVILTAIGGKALVQTLIVNSRQKARPVRRPVGARPRRQPG
jgi:hypothetical protein